MYLVVFYSVPCPVLHRCVSPRCERYDLVLGIFSANNSKLFDAFINRYCVVNTLHGAGPFNNASTINSVCAACLPSASPFPNLLPPHAFLLSEHVLVVPVPRVEQMSIA
jgi:hypothetical protein